MDGRPPALDRGDAAGDRDLLLEHPQAAELDRLSRSSFDGAAERLGVGARHLGHRPQPVKDAPWQAHLARELLVDVDRVEVPGSTRVTDGEKPVGGDLELELVACLHDSPRTMLVQVPVQTVSPSWLTETVSNT